MLLMTSASKVLARLHRWYSTAWVLSRVPLGKLDDTSVGRLRYALMMAHREYPARAGRLLQHVIERNADTAPELLVELGAMATSVADPVLSNQLLTKAMNEAQDAFTRDVAPKLVAVNQGAMNVSLSEWVCQRVDALALPSGEGLLVLVPLSGRYLDLWQLWLEQVRKHIVCKVVVLAMDEAALLAVQDEADVHAIDAREYFAWDARGSLHPQTRGVLWYLRVLFLRDLVHRGHYVLVLDLDAIPVGDLAPMLAGMPPADVIAQQDHSLPMDVNRQHGFVLCCGFMLWHPTAAAGAMLDRFAAETAIERDDQMALNHMLARDGITERSGDPVRMGFRSAGVQFVCPNPSLVSRTLHSGSVVRHFQQEGKSVAELRAALDL